LVLIADDDPSLVCMAVVFVFGGGMRLIERTAVIHPVETLFVDD